ncbi:MAG TPA: hypothetical protein VGS80_09120 [Ktedonobacterales bacterium]|nr:hypothetical protein [Ktedonobacterales bacterium]
MSTWPLLIAAIVAVGLAGCGQAYLSARTVAPTPAPPTAVPTATAGTLPTPAPPSDPWIPLKSHSAADILAAVRQAPFLQVVAGAPPGSDGYFDVSHLGTPMLVLAYRVPPHYQGVDYYEVPTLTASGMVDGTISAQLNAKHTAINVGSISGTDPAAGWPSKLVSASQAVEIVEVQQHTSLRAGANITLIYMATYDTAAVETGQINWSAGGAGPMDPNLADPWRRRPRPLRRDRRPRVLPQAAATGAAELKWLLLRVLCFERLLA